MGAPWHNPVNGLGFIGPMGLQRKPVRGTQLLGEGAEPVNPADMDWWITQRIPFWVANPATGNTGDMEAWVTDRIYLDNWAGVP